MFHKIQELIDDSDALVCVLIDEVSHTHTYLMYIRNFCVVWYLSIVYVYTLHGNFTDKTISLHIYEYQKHACIIGP